MTCRALAAAGNIKRHVNPTGKIGNYPLGETVLEDRRWPSASTRQKSQTLEASQVQPQQKPPLPVETLLAGGFRFAGRWVESVADGLVPDRALPKGKGVYGFAKNGVALYVGVATMGLAKRLYSYSKPGGSQLTNIRLNGLIRSELLTTSVIEIYTAEPPDLEWNGLPIHGSAGLELGLIRKYALPWNMRSASD